jgi:hypothetical protein
MDLRGGMLKCEAAGWSSFNMRVHKYLYLCIMNDTLLGDSEHVLAPTSHKRPAHVGRYLRGMCTATSSKR